MIQRCVCLTAEHNDLFKILSEELTAKIALGTGNSIFVPVKTQSECDDIENIANKYEGVTTRNVTLEKEYVVFVDNIKGGYDQKELYSLIEELREDSCFDEISDAWATCAAIADPNPNNQYHGMNTVTLGCRFAMFDEAGKKTKLVVYPISYISIL